VKGQGTLIGYNIHGLPIYNYTVEQLKKLANNNFGDFLNLCNVVPNHNINKDAEWEQTAT